MPCSEGRLASHLRELGDAFGERGGGALGPGLALRRRGEGGIADDSLGGDVAGSPHEGEGGAHGAELGLLTDNVRQWLLAQGFTGFFAVRIRTRG